MRAAGTNIVVHYLIRDGSERTAVARAAVSLGPAFLPRTVVLKVEWVLRSVYRLRPRRIVAGIRAFAGLPGVPVEDPALEIKTLGWTEQGVDFADTLHLAAAAKCRACTTFDKDFARLASRLNIIPVTTP